MNPYNSKSDNRYQFWFCLVSLVGYLTALKFYWPVIGDNTAVKDIYLVIFLLMVYYPSRMKVFNLKKYPNITAQWKSCANIYGLLYMRYNLFVGFLTIF